MFCYFGLISSSEFLESGDPKESFYIGPLEDDSASSMLNQWPPQGTKSIVNILCLCVCERQCVDF